MHIGKVQVTVQKSSKDTYKSRMQPGTSSKVGYCKAWYCSSSCSVDSYRFTGGADSMVAPDDASPVTLGSFEGPASAFLLPNRFHRIVFCFVDIGYGYPRTIRN